MVSILSRAYKLTDEHKVKMVDKAFDDYIGIHGPVPPREPRYRRPSSGGGSTSDTPLKKVKILDE